MPDSPPIRVACIGAGYFSRFHVEAWRRIDGARPIAMIDHSIEAARDSGLPPCASLDTLLDEPLPDLLDIITPPDTQLAIIRAAIAAGIANIVCQKPFCATLAEAREAVALAEAAGVLLVVHENFRFQPWYRRIREYLEQRLAGDVLQATFRLRPGDGQGARAYLDRQPYFQQMPRFLVHETAIHWIDTFRYLFGRPRSVYADLRRINPHIAGEDAGLILFEHAGGTRALFDGNRLLDHAADNHRLTMGEALIEGTAGTLILDGHGALDFRAFGEKAGRRLLEARDWPGFGGDCVQALQAALIAALQSGATPENSAREYLDNLLIEEAVYASASEGRRLVIDYASVAS